MRKSTRATLVAVALATLFAIPGLVVASHTGFVEVSGTNPFHDDIAWLSQTGITKGCATTQFCPNDNVTRGQMAAFLHRFSQQSSGSPTDPLLASANLATAAYQDVEEAVADGYVSTLGPGEGSLGCFEDPTKGGMGVHYLKASLLDATLDPQAPEALVYEMDNEGGIAGLVGHEYIVPVAAWTGSEPPMVFGRHLHQHPVLPLYVMHTWIWKDNPSGLFEDFNPKVRMCPDGVPVFGQ
ncbi:MAG: S-layer homology domain-containing protein [Acidimicrobiia bacterium]